MFPYIGNFIIPIDFHIFQRGGPTTNQITCSSLQLCPHDMPVFFFYSIDFQGWIWWFQTPIPLSNITVVVLIPSMIDHPLYLIRDTCKMEVSFIIGVPSLNHPSKWDFSLSTIQKNWGTPMTSWEPPVSSRCRNRTMVWCQARCGGRNVPTALCILQTWVPGPGNCGGSGDVWKCLNHQQIHVRWGLMCACFHAIFYVISWDLLGSFWEFIWFSGIFGGEEFWDKPNHCG